MDTQYSLLRFLVTISTSSESGGVRLIASLLMVCSMMSATGSGVASHSITMARIIKSSKLERRSEGVSGQPGWSGLLALKMWSVVTV